MKSEKAYIIVSEMVTALKKEYPFLLRDFEGYEIDGSLPGYVDLTLYAVAPITYPEITAIMYHTGRVQEGPHLRITPEGEDIIKIEVEFRTSLIK